MDALHEFVHDAPGYVAFTDPAVSRGHWLRFADWEIRQSWLTKIPFYKTLFSPLRIWAPEYFSRFDLSEYDLVISSSNAYFSKAVRVPNGTHVCYCHTPARSLYGYTTMTDWKRNPVTRVAGSLINHSLRVRDWYISQEVDHYIANSNETAKRIAKFYRRSSIVVYPPVNIPETAPAKQLAKRNYYLSVGRIAQSKHVDLAILAANELKVPLKVVGTGKGLEYLRQLAGSTVEFMGEVTDEELSELYAGAKALFFPAEDEDFGIVPVEAMGHGVPVIAHRSGGPLESVLENKTGVFFEEFTVDAVVAAVKKLDTLSLNTSTIYKHAQKFAKVTFQEKMLKTLAEMILEKK